MKVIGAGMGRTGTLSLKVALERLLGGRCYHMEEVIGNDEHLRTWYAWARIPHVRVDWRSLFEGYVAGVDAPVCFVYEELMEAFPEAKVILTVRDPDRWYESWEGLAKMTRRSRPLRHVVPKMRWFVPFTSHLMERYFDSRIDRQSNIRAFEAHNARVKATVPSDRLLVFSVKEGWEPLCEHLGVPVPDEPFPHLNDGLGNIRAAQREMVLERLRRPFG